MSRRPLLIGLTGAIGVGKSSALTAFALRGCPVLSADEVVHGLYLQPAVREQLVAEFGPSVIGADAMVDRSAVARRCFGDADALAWLEQVLHPLVAAQLEVWLAGLTVDLQAPGLCVYESPLLFEAGQADRFDRVLVVTAPEAVRQRRLAERGGLERLAEREGRQWDSTRRLAAADDILDNAGTPEQLQEAVDAYIARYAGS